MWVGGVLIVEEENRKLILKYSSTDGVGNLKTDLIRCFTLKRSIFVLLVKLNIQRVLN